MAKEQRILYALQRFLETGDVLWSGSRVFYGLVASKVLYRTVLDVGCGIGAGSAILARNADVVGVEQEADAVAFARALYPWVGWLCGDFLDPMLALSQVDVVVGIEVLEHVWDQQGMARRMISLAKEKVWVSTPNARGKVKPPRDDRHTKELEPEEVRELFAGKRVVTYDWQGKILEEGKEPEGSLLYEVTL